MNDEQLKTALFTLGIFSLGAVALILYQHSMHTGQIVGAINAAGMNTGNSIGTPNSVSPVATGNASLAGTPSPVPAANNSALETSQPININSGYMFQ